MYRLRPETHARLRLAQVALVVAAFFALAPAAVAQLPPAPSIPSPSSATAAVPRAPEAPSPAPAASSARTVAPLPSDPAPAVVASDSLPVAVETAAPAPAFVAPEPQALEPQPGASAPISDAGADSPPDAPEGGAPAGGAPGESQSSPGVIEPVARPPEPEDAAPPPPSVPTPPAPTSDLAPLLPVLDDAAEELELVLPVVEPVLEPVLPVIEDVVEPVLPVVEPVVEPVLEPVLPVIEDVVEPVLPVVEDVVEPVLEPVLPVVEDVVEPVLPVVEPVLSAIGGRGGAGAGPDRADCRSTDCPGFADVRPSRRAVAPVPDSGDQQPPAEQLWPGPSSSSPPSPLDTPPGPGSEPNGAGERFPLSGEAPAVSVSPDTTTALLGLGASPDPVVAQALAELKSEGAGTTPVSSSGRHNTTAAVALPCYATAPMSGLAPPASSGTERVRDSGPGDGPSETPSPPSPSTCSGTSGGSGSTFRALFADLVTLAAFAAQPFSRRFQRASAWRPAAFVAVIERPG
jgi:hypothetical protein